MSILDRIEGELAEVAHAIRDHILAIFHTEKERIMARIEELESNVASIGSATDRAVAELADLKAKIEALGAEDPRIAALADQTKAIADKLTAAVPAPVVAEAAPAEQPAP